MEERWERSAATAEDVEEIRAENAERSAYGERRLVMLRARMGAVVMSK